MITENLFEEVLMNPVENGADRLLVVSGYATSAMAFHHLDRLRKRGYDTKVDLIVGMSIQDGLSLSNHRGFQKIVTDDFADDFTCRYLYVRPPVHSKIYVWLEKNRPVQCFAGSANYSQTAFGKLQREVLTHADPHSGYDYFNSLNPQTIFCENLDVEGLITIYSDDQYQQRFAKIVDAERDEQIIATDEEDAVDDILRCVKVSFLDKEGNLPEGASGLNWAFRPGKPRKNLNEAYIQLPPVVYKSDFFPLRGNHFTVLTDDGKSLICTRAQKDERGHAIETPQNNGLLGEYFRHRLGLPYGSKVTKEDLLNYGRTDIEFCKIDDETYEMDFSV